MADGLQIRLFGEIEVTRDGVRVPLPQSRKPRALLAYLVLKGQPQRRDALCVTHPKFLEMLGDLNPAKRQMIEGIAPAFC